MIIDPVNSSSSPLQYSQYKTDAENIKTTASVVLAKANRTITKIKDQKAEGISPDRRISIFTKCENITEIVGKLQKESDPEAALLAKELTDVQTTLFEKLSPIRLIPKDSETGIDIPPRLALQMASIKAAIIDTELFEEMSVTIAKEDLAQVLDYLKGINGITKENWLTLTKAALYLDISELQTACSSFAEKNLSLSDFVAMKISDKDFTQFAHTISADYSATLFTQWADNKETVLKGWIKNIPHIIVGNESDFSAFIDLAKTGNFNNLTSLHIANISPAQAQELLKRVPNLEKLDITGCKSIAEIPAGFTKLKELVAPSGLTQEGLNALATSSPHIEKLDISRCLFIKAIPAGFTKLKEFVAAGWFTQEGLNALATSSPHIEKLDISRCLFIKAILAGFKELKELVAPSKLTQEGLNALATSSPALEKLNIQWCRSITAIPAGFTKLKELVAGFSGFTQDGLNALATSSPHIEKLNIGGCTSITAIPAGFTKLKELVPPSGLTQEGLNALATSSPALEKLNIGGCTSITAIPAGFTKLKELDAPGSGLKQDGLNALATSSPHIEKLNIGWCTSITAIPAGFTKLKELDARGSGLKQDGLNALATSSPHIEKLNIGWCTSITAIPAGFTKLKEWDARGSGLKQDGLNALATTYYPHLGILSEVD